MDPLAESERQPLIASAASSRCVPSYRGVDGSGGVDELQGTSSRRVRFQPSGTAECV